MRKPLQKFTAFANSLLPHETSYLLSIEAFQDQTRLEMLRAVDYNAHHIDQFTPYDVHIDKRKYNHLQNWIQTRLDAIDVDVHFRWMHDLQQAILTDTIDADQEKDLLKAIRNYQHPGFSFRTFYNLVEHYRHYLLIRLRYVDHELVNQFLEQYRAEYKRSVKIDKKIHEATLDIVDQYRGKSTDSSQWEEWLTSIFYDETLEGQLRYLAMVRLTFISYNYRRFDQLRPQLEYLDAQFAKGQFYSKRLLTNYYNTRLMMHSHFKEYSQARYYGYLSIRSQTQDYLLYVNNLCAVLLRKNQHMEALELMKNASPEAKKTKNLYNRVSFVAFYMQSLNKNALYRNAESYGNSFLRAYSKEVLQYRWHLFFSIYLESLLHQHQYEKIIKTVRKYQLLKRDKGYSQSANYFPVIPLYLAAARFKEGLISKPQLIAKIEQHKDLICQDQERIATFQKLMNDYKQWLPEVSTSDLFSV